MGLGGIQEEVSGQDRRRGILLRAQFLLLLAVLAGALFSIYLVVHAHSANGADGFPLDDPWIHLTYARNLHDHHAFSYFPGDPSTQGSTSPLYTGLLALGFGITRNEKILSYTLGILFHALFLSVLALWASKRLGSPLWAAVVVLLVGLDTNIAILSISGMETSLFLFLVAAAFLALMGGNRLLTAAALGLSVWVRPDGLILVALSGLVAAFDRFVVTGPGRNGHAQSPGGTANRAQAGSAVTGRREGVLPGVSRALLLLALLLAGYFLFNLAIGHSLLPNTFAAKTAYYRENPRRLFPALEMAPAFFHRGWVVVLPFVLFGLGREALRLVRRRPSASRAEAGWTIALPLAYFALLPFAHRFSRYLIPAVPAFALLGIGVLKELAGRAPRRRLGFYGGIALVAVVLGLQIRGAAGAAETYAELCHYHAVRHERTGRWLAENTPPGAVVATHDIGAIGFYSARRVVDVVGVAWPDAVRHLNQPDYIPYLESLFAAQRVTHLAVLRNWLGVDNVPPLFTADPRPEVMEVFPWIPGRTHLIPRVADQMAMQAIQALRSQQTERALSILQAALGVDGKSARLWNLAGNAWETAERPDRAEDCYRRALELFPDADEPRFRLGVVQAKQDKLAQARETLAPLAGRQPAYPGLEELRDLIGL